MAFGFCTCVQRAVTGKGWCRTGSLGNGSEERVWNRGMLSDAVARTGRLGDTVPKAHVLGLLCGRDSSGTLSDHAVSQRPVS